jgi:predicted RND superfamily exporter protein
VSDPLSELTGPTSSRGARMADWLLAHSKVIVAGSVLLTVLLALPMLTLAPDTTASQMPSGEVVEAQELVSERFVSDVYFASFIVEAREGNILSKEPLLELLENSRRLRSDADVSSKLFAYFSPEVGADVDGIYTIADEVDTSLSEAGIDGLETASEDEVARTVAALVQEGGPTTWGLVSSATVDPASGSWESPALIVTLVAENDALGGGGQAITLGSDDTTKEEFARDAQDLLRGGERSLQVWGVAIDVNLTVGEQASAAGPFIGFTILAVLVVAGFLLRSYWAVAVLGAALGALMIWLKGLSNLIGLENDQVLSFIVPIAMISFGVDFAFHAVGRYREERSEGYRPRPAFIIGMGGVMAALVLALASDSVAFLSNVTSGIESIIQFGIAAAIALVAAYLVLGIVTPLVLMRIDEVTGSESPSLTKRVGRELGSALAATAAMAVVLFLVYILPWVGAALWGTYLLAFVILPYSIVRRQAADAEDPALSKPGKLRGRWIGRSVAAVARWRRVILPIVLITWVAAIVVALQIEARFDVQDFFAADTDFVIGLDKLDEHIGQQGGEPADIYVETDLTQPAALRAIDEFAEKARRLNVDELAVDDTGETTVQDGVLGTIRDVMDTPFAIQAVGGVTGVVPTDEDGDGIPDSSNQVDAIYSFTSENGVPLDNQRLVRTPDTVGMGLWQGDDGRTHATVLTLGVVGSRSQENVASAREALDPLVEDLRTELRVIDPEARVVLTGSAITRHEQLLAIMRALFVALPISVLACLILGAAFMRSIRFGLVSVVPILVVVAWLYAFMHLAGYGINVVTATIGAVSIGIGIDFAIHFIMRYREEMERVSDRLGAVRAAGEGTGSALVASAVSSIVGFAIMALAPMPMFSAYGFLTAIMIFMALLATLAVLPGLLILVTPGSTAPGSTAPPPSLVEVGET